MLRHSRFTAFAVIAAAAVALPPRTALATCQTPANAIEAENCLAGDPQSVWDVSGGGDPSIQGFATDISVNRGGTVTFKVSTDASAYRIDIYRIGYYGGAGARLVATINPAAASTQAQPACANDPTTGLVDCGNWAESASWPVPASATSGVYFARLVRTDTGGASHVPFVVRDDASVSPILFKTSDTTWEAYNDWGGKSLYGCNGNWDLSCRAYAVSYNRPFHTRVYEAESWFFNAEYPMVRWLERNGYDVSYVAAVDVARSGTRLLNHKLFMTNGHDEYWSAEERTAVETARGAGIHVAFFSGNNVFWKTRWAPAAAGAAVPYRTLVCYKETHGDVTPPAGNGWTGTWRDPSFGGGQPENALTGTLYEVNGVFNDAITVTQADGRLRFWRGTSIASLPGARRRRSRRGRSGPSSTSTSTTPPGPRARSVSPRARSPVASSSSTRDIPTARVRGRTASSCTGTRAARSSSPPGLTSGRGASTRTTTGRASVPRRLPRCSRRR